MAKVLDQTARTALGLSIRIAGNLGPATFRRLNKRTSIAYRERRRTSALTPKQKAHRTKFNRAYEQWRSLTNSERDDWRRVADAISSRMIGSHLFMRVWWKQDTHFIDQVSLWYFINLNLPGP